jgi:hypothetical protein
MDPTTSPLHRNSDRNDFAPACADRLEFHYVPKHASWLNMVEIEIGVLAAQCLDRRIESIKQLAAETAIWEQPRNAVAARVNGCSEPTSPRQNGPRLSTASG